MSEAAIGLCFALCIAAVTIFSCAALSALSAVGL